MGDIVRDLLGSVQDLRKTLDKKLNEWNVEHAWVKHAITGLNSEANALKAEVTGITTAAKGASAEVTGASFGFKLFNAEKTLFDMQEMRDKARGLDPESLKAGIRAVEQRVAATRSSLARTILRVRGELTALKSATETAVAGAKHAAERAAGKAEAAEEKADHAEAQARRALGQQRGAATAAGRPTGRERTVDVRNIREAEQAIRALEGRINRLVQALE
ncbi:MAG: hypothetical protein HOY76_52740 [Streptomyces sp.]|nr:hypothetical protein [Streptomyces sp.]NUS85885.1 hypothetical protein [Streptomyces sp.]